MMPVGVIALDVVSGGVGLEVGHAAQHRRDRVEAGRQFGGRHVMQYVTDHDQIERPVEPQCAQPSERALNDPARCAKAPHRVVARFHSHIAQLGSRAQQVRAPGRLAAPDVEDRTDGALEQCLGDAHDKVHLARDGRRLDHPSRGIAVPAMEVLLVVGLRSAHERTSAAGCVEASPGLSPRTSGRNPHSAHGRSRKCPRACGPHRGGCGR